MSWLQTPIEKKVESCTSELLADADWGMIMEIVDSLRGQSQDTVKAFAKAIRKRTGSKKPKVASLALTLLEACFKNAGQGFQVACANSDMMKALVNVTERKKEPALVEQALQLLASWAEAFPSNSQLPIFAETHAKLRAKGVVFPPVTSPVIAPPAKPQAAAPASAASAAPVPASASAASGAAASSQSRHPLEWVSPDFIAKTRSELGVVFNYAQMLRDLVAANPDPEELRRDVTVTSVAATLGEIRTRLNRLLAEIEHEALLGLCIEAAETTRAVLEMHKAALQGARAPIPDIVLPPELAGDDAKERKASPSPTAAPVQPIPAAAAATPAPTEGKRPLPAAAPSSPAPAAAAAFDLFSIPPAQPQPQPQPAPSFLPPGPAGFPASAPAPAPISPPPDAGSPSSAEDDPFALLRSPAAAAAAASSQPPAGPPAAAPQAPSAFDMLALGSELPPPVPTVPAPAPAAGAGALVSDPFLLFDPAKPAG